jgi:hypothetical protein
MDSLVEFAFPIIFRIAVFGDFVAIKFYYTPVSELTWGSIGVKALRRWLFTYEKMQHGEEINLRSIRGGKIQGLEDVCRGKFHAANNTIDLRHDLARNPFQYRLRFEGPILQYSDPAIVCFFFPFLWDVNLVVELMRTCKRFNKIFSSDHIWQELLVENFKGICSRRFQWKWKGIGKYLITESQLWSTIGSEHNLSIKVQCR